VEIRFQHVVKKQPQLVHVPRPMEEKELQQLMSRGKSFIQKLFEEGPISSIIPQRPR
jgi:hypothetical protein